MTNVNLYDLTYREVEAIVKTSLEELGTSHGLKGEVLNNFTTDNLLTVSDSVYVWYGMFRSCDSKWQDAIKAVGNNVFKQIESAGQVASKLIATMSKHRPPLADVATPQEARLILGALRFSKRCALQSAPWLEAEAKDKFWKAFDLNPNYKGSPDDLKGDALMPNVKYGNFQPWLMRWIPVWRKWLDQLLPPVEYYHLGDISEFSFPTGATQDSCTNPVCKYYRVKMFREPSGKLPIKWADPVQGRDMYEEWVRGAIPTNSWKALNDAGDPRARIMIVPRPYTPHEPATTSLHYLVTPITVPKQLNAVRTIAMEDSAHSQIQNYISKRTRKYWKKLGYDHVFAQDDQDVNRKRAIDGSRDGSWDTIDSTSASDTIKRWLIRLIDHPTLNYWMSFMPTHVKWGKKVRPMSIFGTMGSSETFDNEMVIFLLVGLTAVATCFIYEWGFLPCLSYLLRYVSVVGDDLIVKGGCGETAIDILKVIGCIPNLQKSFCEGFFKESCGAEAWSGYRVDAPYWPRGLDCRDLSTATWDGFREEYWSGLTALIHLHNELVHEWPAAADRVVEVLATYHDVDRFSYPEATPEGLLRDPGVYHYEDTRIPGYDPNVLDPKTHTPLPRIIPQSRSRRVTSVRSNNAWESPVLEMPSLVRVSAEPKATCWCKSIPKEQYAAMERYYYDTYLAMYGPRYVLTSGQYIYDSGYAGEEVVPNGPTEPYPRLGRTKPVYCYTDVVVTR
jgi:hypothetical protein